MKKEFTILKVGNMFKATMRVPEMSVSQTKVFSSKKKAEEWLDKWKNFRW